MKIRKAVDEFEAFALRGNVLDFVMAVVIGGAIGRIITACVDGLVMPSFAYWLRETQWEKKFHRPPMAVPSLRTIPSAWSPP